MGWCRVPRRQKREKGHAWPIFCILWCQPAKEPSLSGWKFIFSHIQTVMLLTRMQGNLLKRLQSTQGIIHHPLRDIYGFIHMNVLLFVIIYNAISKTSVLRHFKMLDVLCVAERYPCTCHVSLVVIQHMLYLYLWKIWYIQKINIRQSI